MKERLTKLRKKMELTQAEFAKRIEITRSTYSNIELGNTNVTDRNVNKICNEFNINELWLRTGEGEMFKSMEGDKELLDFVVNILADKNDIARKTFTALARLDASDWDVVEKIIDSFQKK